MRLYLHPGGRKLCGMRKPFSGLAKRLVSVSQHIANEARFQPVAGRCCGSVSGSPRVWGKRVGNEKNLGTVSR